MHLFCLFLNLFLTRFYMPEDEKERAAFHSLEDKETMTRNIINLYHFENRQHVIELFLWNQLEPIWIGGEGMDVIRKSF